MSNDAYIEVAVPLPLHTTYTYRASSADTRSLQIGMRVLVPFGKRRLSGYIIGFPETAPAQKLKEIYDLLDNEPLFSIDDLAFYRWAASYYCHPLGQTIQTALPAGLSAEYRHVISITNAGTAALASAKMHKTDAALLRTLAESGPGSVRELQKTLCLKNLGARIQHLTAKGFLRESFMKKGGALKIRCERWYIACPAVTAPRLTKKQNEVLSHICTSGPLPWHQLKESLGNCRAQLKALHDKGLIEAEDRETYRRPQPEERLFSEPEHQLTPEQQNIWNTLSDTVAQQQFYPLLLHGVTGSGKTEIYLRIMDQALKQGRQCLFLVPEIALTTQLWDRISSRLRVPIAMLHSSLTAAERFDAWRMIRRGDVNVVIGARSAIFASFKNLGAIVVDEEHDPSYKQDEKMRYHARDLALLKGKYAKCIVVLGSATPSFESYYNAHTGKYQLARLRQRVDNRPLPRVDIIDMKLEKALQRKKGGILSRALTQEIKQRLAKEQQTLIFFNRRGFAPSYICQECGHAFTCPNCDVSLIHHHRQRKLCCHYCNHARPVPQECPACGSFFLISLGWGTERLEKEIAHLFPEARIARMDRDTTSHKGASRAILKQMADGSLDILIGTQMIVKGFHLPRVTLVGVISADQSLNFPDYRASERTFQLLTQVAGRAGRGSIEGEVIIQTYTPEHYSIACARQHDYEKFFKHEMKFRRELAYPPYTKMVNIRFDGTNQLQVTQLAQKAGACARTVLDRNNGADNIEILGPARAPWEKIKNRYRYQMLLKGTSTQTLHIFSQQILQMARNEIKNSDTRVSIDVDPVFVL